MHSESIFGAWTRHGHTRIHKTHHSSDLGETITFPFICAWPHDLHPNVILFQDSQVVSFEVFEIGTPTILERHNSL
jgi:hypothetical protein